jgi:hypothetical protein
VPVVVGSSPAAPMFSRAVRLAGMGSTVLCAPLTFFLIAGLPRVCYHMSE